MAGAPQLRLLGVPQLVAVDGSVRELDRRDAALLALLALQGPMPRATVAAWLWPDRVDALARANLRQHLFKLKRAVGMPVVAGDDRIGLAEGIAHDLHPTGSTVGDLLAGLRYDDLPALDDWLGPARQRWQRLTWQALTERADRAEEDRRWDDALAVARQMVEIAPTSEAAHRRLARVYYLRGDTGAARQVLAQCRQVLAGEGRDGFDAETASLARLLDAACAPSAVSTWAPGTLPLALLRTPQVVGRDEVLAALQRVVSRHQVPVLIGDAGVGKSRLGQAFIGRLPMALVVHARPGDAARPWALATRLLQALDERLGLQPQGADRDELARLWPALGPPAAGRASAARLRQALAATWAQAAARHRFALLVDDVQFADDPSVEALLDWLHAPEACLWPRLLATREHPLPSALSQALAAGGSTPFVAVPLPPLDAGGVLALLQSLQLPALDVTAWAPALLQHTGGHPMFLLETLRACHEQGLHGAQPPRPLPTPPSLSNAIVRRLDALSPAAQRLLRAMALAWPDRGPQLMADVLEASALDLVDAWAELQARHLVRDDGPSHDLVTETVLAQVPPPLAATLHACIAAVLEARGHDDRHCAEHWRRAGQWAQAAKASLRAADRAGAQGHREDEMRLLHDAAQAWMQAGDDDAAFEARLRRAQAMTMDAPLTQALAEIDALDIAGRSTAQHARVALLRARAHLAAIDGPGAQALSRQALRLAQAAGDAATAFAAGLTLGSALAHGGQTTEALQVLDALAEHADCTGNLRERCDFHGTRGYVLATCSRHREALQPLKQAVALAEELHDPSEQVTLLSNLAGVLSLQGQVPQALAVAEQAHALRLHVPGTQGLALAVSETVVGLACTAAGHFARGEQVLLAALDRFVDSAATVWRVATETMLANLYLQLGQVARARRVLAPLPDDLPAARRARRLVVEARLRHATGRPALDLMRQAWALIQGPQRPMDRIGVAMTLAIDEAPDAAIDVLQSVLELALQHQLDAQHLSVRVRLCDAWRRRGRPDAATPLARQALLDARTCWPYDLSLAELGWTLYQALAAGGDQAAADDALRLGVAWWSEACWHVPTAWRESFAHRQPVHRQLLAAAASRGIRPDSLPSGKR